jgi:transcriptional regulator with GAF, ATPase, and Fis domain
MAKMIFFNSPRREREFVAVNCSAIPDTLFESEMFGIEKGVATGVSQRKGLIEESSGGTLFLDEVGDMAPENQAKLLRVLEEREVMHVGGHRPIPVDLHVISATNADIRESVRARRFREDLYYRLNVMEIVLPPLRERGDDVLLLARDFLRRHALRLGRERMSLSPEADALLMAYPWPGNVRELNNEMERAASLAPDLAVRREDLSERIRSWTPGREAAGAGAARAAPAPLFRQDGTPPARGAGPADGGAPSSGGEAPSEAGSHRPGGPLPGEAPAPDGAGQEAQARDWSGPRHTDQMVLDALARSGGNKTRAAKLLGLTREGFRKRMKKLDAGEAESGG